MPSYRTITLQNLVDSITSRIGTTWSDLDSEIQERIVDFVNDRMVEGYTRFEWPELKGIEKRYFQQGKWFAGSYAANDIVYYEPNEKYYKNTSGGSTSGVPGASSDWEEINSDTFSKAIPLDQTDKDTDTTAADVVYDMYRDDPALYNFQTNVNFNYIANDITVNAVSQQAIITYAEGLNSVYIQFYSAITTHATGSMSATIPHFFRGFLSRSVYSDWLESEGQHDKALLQERKAKGLLEQQYENQMLRQRQMNAHEPGRRPQGNTAAGVT